MYPDMTQIWDRILIGVEINLPTYFKNLCTLRFVNFYSYCFDTSSIVNAIKFPVYKSWWIFPSCP